MTDLSSTLAAAPPAPAAYPGIGATIGGTPLVRLHPRGFDGVAVWAKLEGFNPGGSAKDRSAAGMVDAALADGRLTPGGRIVESSSGNAGVALAMLAAAQGLRFTCVIDPRTNPSTRAVIAAFGAEIDEVTEPVDGDWLAARLARVQELVADDPDAVWLDQYSNDAAVAAHREGTMREIVQVLGAPDWLLVAASTTGTIGGCLSYAGTHGLATRVVAVDAEGSVLFGGMHGERHLPGYGAGVLPKLAEGLEPERVIRVPDAGAVASARAVARREGVLLGASGGAVCAALTTLRDAVVPGETVVLLLHDGGQPYADTVYSDAWVAENLGVDADELSAQVEDAW